MQVPIRYLQVPSKSKISWQCPWAILSSCKWFVVWRNSQQQNHQIQMSGTNKKKSGPFRSAPYPVPIRSLSGPCPVPIRSLLSKSQVPIVFDQFGTCKQFDTCKVYVFESSNFVFLEKHIGTWHRHLRVPDFRYHQVPMCCRVRVVYNLCCVIKPWQTTGWRWLMS